MGREPRIWGDGREPAIPSGSHTNAVGDPSPQTHHLKIVARLYMQALASDVPAASVISTRLGVTVGSARTYIHRARRAGLIAPVHTRTDR